MQSFSSPPTFPCKIKTLRLCILCLGQKVPLENHHPHLLLRSPEVEAMIRELRGNLPMTLNTSFSSLSTSLPSRFGVHYEETHSSTREKIVSPQNCTRFGTPKPTSSRKVSEIVMPTAFVSLGPFGTTRELPRRPGVRSLAGSPPNCGDLPRRIQAYRHQSQRSGFHADLGLSKR